MFFDSTPDFLYPDFKVVHSEWLHWSRGGLNWNTMCSDCHSTNVRKNYDLKTESFNTKYALINVNCEACHGPASNHLLWAKMEDESKLDIAYTAFPNKSISLSSEETLNQCTFCHARRSSLGDNDHKSSHYLNQFLPMKLEKC